MDYSKGWQEGMTPEDTKNLAYYERNMAVLYMANYSNKIWAEFLEYAEAKGDDITEELAKGAPSGWYVHEGDEFKGWSRVISIGSGTFTVHVPDDFNMGTLPQINPNWNNHTTEEKWNMVKKVCGIVV